MVEHFDCLRSGKPPSHSPRGKVLTEGNQNTSMNKPPSNLRWWCSTKGLPTNHQSRAYAYNQLWENFFATTPYITQQHIIVFMQNIQGRFTYTC